MTVPVDAGRSFFYRRVFVAFYLALANLFIEISMLFLTLKDDWYIIKTVIFLPCEYYEKRGEHNGSNFLFERDGQ